MDELRHFTRFEEVQSFSLSPLPPQKTNQKHFAPTFDHCILYEMKPLCSNGAYVMCLCAVCSGQCPKEAMNMESLKTN